MSFTRMLREGPEVSLRGSPTVSPMTAAYDAGGGRVRVTVGWSWGVGVGGGRASASASLP
jgi:hypothetical protein